MRSKKFFASIFSLLLTLSYNAHAKLTDYSDFYFFGDSLSDVGNNGCNTNIDGTSKQCMTWANDIYLQRFNDYVKPSNQGGNDYAVGGAVSIDTVAQVNQYLASHNNQADPNAYYFLLVGGNDIMNLAIDAADQLKEKMSRLAPMQALGVLSQTVGMFNYNLEGTDRSLGIVTHQIQAVKMLTLAGAKHIMVINMPNIDYAPAVQDGVNKLMTSCENSIFVSKADKPICLQIGQGINGLVDMLIRDYNDTLSRKMASNFDPSVVKMYSMYDATQNIIQQGILNPNGACDGTAEQCQDYVFFNSVHPSARAQAIMADKIAALI